jgi:hypothetical protein
LLRRKLVDESHYRILVGGRDVDVYKPDGSRLLVFRHQVLPADVCRRAYPALLRAAVPSHNRGNAAGDRFRRVKIDGKLSNTLDCDPVSSGIIGHYVDRPRRGEGGYVCRTTKYTAKDVEGWFDDLPFIRAVNDVFEREVFDRYAVQMEAIRQTPPRYIIPGTVFTTVTVNRNFRTRVHKDAGDLKEGFGAMSVIQAGEYEGGYLVFQKYRIAVDMRSQDVLLADVHEFHGNTAIVGVEGEYERISTVMYFRSRMRICRSPAEEQQ